MSHSHRSIKRPSSDAAPEERMEVVERILDSLDEPDATLDALWATEADDRLEAHRCGEIKAVPLSDVIAKYQVNIKRA